MFDSELLAAKTPNKEYKNKVVLFDVLQAGDYLFGVKQLDRLSLLRKLCNDPQEYEPTNQVALTRSKDVWMAETFFDDFKQEFDRHKELDEIEGLLLRRLDSSLDSIGDREYEVAWQIRCRKPHKNYNF